MHLITLSYFHCFHACLYLQELFYRPSLPLLGKWHSHKSALGSSLSGVCDSNTKHQYLKVLLHIYLSQIISQITYLVQVSEFL